MSQQFRVEAIKRRFMKAPDGVRFEIDGIVAHRSFIRAQSEEDAIEAVRSFHLTPGTKYDYMRATPVNGLVG